MQQDYALKTGYEHSSTKFSLQGELYAAGYERLTADLNNKSEHTTKASLVLDEICEKLLVDVCK